MYISTDLTIKTVELSKVTDSLLFTSSINKESIPYSGKYGIRINANPYTIWDVSYVALTNAISNLGYRNLKLKSMDIDMGTRKVNAVLSYSAPSNDSTIGGTPEAVNLGVSVHANIN